MKQIERNAQDKMLEQEKKDQESQQMLKYLEKLQVEDMKWETYWKQYKKHKIFVVVVKICAGLLTQEVLNDKM